MNWQHLHDIQGLHFMPVREDKRPIVKEWQTSPNKHDLSSCAGVGIVCGQLSGGLEVLDIDVKYDLTGKLWDSVKRGIETISEDLFSRLLVQKTKNGGYHLFYRCSKLSGNLKLANRPTTVAEREFTYKETYEYYFKDAKVKVKTEEGAIATATKARDGDKVRVLLETRGEGGFVMTFPSKGYELIQRGYDAIEEITPDERDAIHTIARQFNQVFEEIIIPKTQMPKTKIKGKSSFEDYDERCDIVQLLTSHGWKFVKNKGNKIHFQRPGQTSAETSGNFDTSSNWFSVFTTSTEFETNHGYRPYAVFAVLECNKDFSEASRRLYAMGFGDRDEPTVKEKAPSTRIIQSRINLEDNDLSFLATGEDYNPYLQQVIDGTLPMGLTTGSPALDEWFLLKEATFVNINGHANTGKTVWVWWLLMLAAMYHKWEGNIYSSENSTGNFMRKMIQFYWGKPLRGFNAQTPQEYAIAKAFCEKHFHLIKADEALYNYKDVLNMNKKLRDKFPNSKYGFIDPYNSLKTDLSGFSKLSTHDYHYEALSELKSYGQATNYGWFINHHAVTEALRKKDSEGYPIAPSMADTEQGGKIGNKTDDFITGHRKTQHPSEWNIMEIHVRKIKDTETGGRPTPLEEPIRFIMKKNQCGYEEVRRDGLPQIDPIARWHQTRTAKTEEEKHWADRKDHQTFEQFKEAEKVEKAIDFYKKVNPQTIAEGYVPDDEEKAELERMKKNGNLF